MSKIELRVRNIENGEAGTVTFDDEKAADVWLRARPRFVIVLGEVEKMEPELGSRLRAAMRPLDAEEKAVEAKAQADLMAAAKARAEADRKRVEADRVVSKNADPKRPMEIRWTFDGGMALVDVTDDRPISDEAKASVLAFVAERNDWVKGRGQMVGDATVIVYPLELPAKAGGERVVSGKFIPVTLSEKPHSQN